jgi:hypothetical protein
VVPCAFCGFKNVPGTLFCEGCGSGLTPEAQGHRYGTGEVPAVAASRSAAGAAVEAPIVAPAVEDVAPTEAVPAEQGENAHDVTAAPPEPVYAGETAATEPAAAGEIEAAQADVAAPAQEAEPAAPPAYLISESGRRVDVPAQDVVIVGREDMRSGIRPDVDLTLDGASAAGVSRRHCRLLRQDGAWYVEDLMSTNFTVHNGKPLTAHTPTPLHDNDELRLGKMRLRFHQG